MKRLRPRGYRALLRTGRWFAALPDDLQARLLDAAVMKRAAAGEHVTTRGDDPSGLFAVVDGTVRIAGQSDAGREILHMVVEPPSWFGELAVIDDLPRNQHAIADVDSELLHVPRRAVEVILDAEPRYWRHIALLLAHKFRLARRLALMIDGYGDHTHPRRTVELRQEQLAHMLGVSRQTINQILKDLEAQGLIKLAYGEIEILDAAGLRALGEVAALGPI